MSIITGSGTFTYNDSTFSYNGTISLVNGQIAWPITISAGVTVTVGSDLTLTTISQYFIIGGSGVTIDGAGYEVNVPTSYTGLVQNGTSSSTIGYSDCLVKNIGLQSSSGINIGIARNYFGDGTSSCSISNCYVICGGNINAAGGIAGTYNSATISNCYVICGGGIIGTGSVQVGGIAGLNNSAPISNCYVICGGDITAAGGIAGSNNQSTGTIENCYVICGGNINISCGGIAGNNNFGSISNCYVNYSTVSSGGYIFASAGTISDCESAATPTWTSNGAGKLLPSSAWTDITNGTDLRPWLLSAFDTAIASSTTATSDSGTIALNTYGQSFANGTVYTGTNGATFTYNAGSNIAYSSISSGTYTLGLYANDLLSNLTSFTLTNGTTTMRTAFNYNGSNAEEVIPYSYSVTDDVTLTYAAISNICFQEKTPIKTDQGIIQIEKLNPDVNTIKNKKIVGITKTISQDKYLVCFEKDSLGLNYPTKSTTVTKQHKILYRGKMIEAEKFLGHFVGVKKAKYNGGVLYNVLMEKHEVVSANNLVCETLHPQNIIAKLYTSFMSESYKSKLTSLINESILKNDHAAYKKIVNRL